MAVFFTQKKDEKIVNYMYMCVLINWARLCDSSMLSAGMYKTVQLQVHHIIVENWNHILVFYFLQPLHSWSL